MLRRSAAIAFAAVASMLAPLAWAAPAVTLPALKLSTALGPAYTQGRVGAAWAALVNERSSGRLAVKFAPGATLAGRDPLREFAALRDGTIDLAVGASDVWSAQIPALDVFTLPWFVPDRASLLRVLDSGVMRLLARRFYAAGAVALAWCADDFVALATRAAVHGPADVAGLNLRTPDVALIRDTLSALGARPATMRFAEARAALASGALDGEAMSPQAYSATQANAAGLTHLLLWDAHARVLVLAVNAKLWNGWSDADRALVREAAQAAAGSECVASDASDEALLAPLTRQGAVVTRLTSAGKAAFRAATRAVFDRYAPVVGNDIVDAARAAMAAGDRGDKASETPASETPSTPAPK